MSKSNQVRPIFLPAGVAAPDQHIGYVGISGAIEALDLHTGESLWRAEIDARPVLVFENLLVVLSPVKGIANALKLVEVDFQSVFQRLKCLVIDRLVAFICRHADTPRY